MKQLTGVLLAVFLFASCQKKDIKTAESINGDVVSSEGAIEVMPCHATSFTTNYSANPIGKFPPFKFTATQYASGRVKTINMISRANPNHPNFKQQAWELIGTFTYQSNQAKLVGTKQLWEYSKSSTGAAVKKSIIKKNISLTFYFGIYSNPYNSSGTTYNKVYEVRNNLESRLALRMKRNAWTYPDDGTFFIEVLAGSDEPDNYFEANYNYETYPYSMVISSSAVGYRTPPTSYGLRKTITFKYNNTGDAIQRLYQPTQNWISMEYNICEVMGWIGHGGLDGKGYMGERNFVEVRFYPYNNTSLAVQSQVYKNHKYGGGSMLSYTYGDNVLQKNTWICK